MIEVLDTNGRLSIRERLAKLADCLAIAIAVSLPWSTSATSILLVIWLLVVIPTFDWADVRRELMTPAGGLPVLLVLLGVLGTLWADVSIIARWGGLGSFLKLLFIPLLFAQFRRTDRGYWVFGGYIVSCIVLLLLSFVLALWPSFPIHFSHDFGVPVGNIPSQSGEFATCIFGLIFLANEAVTRRRWLWLLGCLTVIVGMLIDMFFVATGRTSLVVMLVLLAVFAVKKLKPRGIFILFTSAIAICAVAWFSSAYLRARTAQIWVDYQNYELRNERNSSGERVEFAKKSIEFIREAPVIGHGTGSIPSLFARSVVKGSNEPAGTNPHNQTFAVAIQLGLVGAFVLWAMWIAHLLLFRGVGLAEWVGLVVVVQNIVGSLFNSHLFDFMQGWVYVVGVGVAGGMAWKNRGMQKSKVVMT